MILFAMSLPSGSFHRGRDIPSIEFFRQAQSQIAGSLPEMGSLGGYMIRSASEYCWHNSTVDRHKLTDPQIRFDAADSIFSRIFCVRQIDRRIGLNP